MAPLFNVGKRWEKRARAMEEGENGKVAISTSEFRKFVILSVSAGEVYSQSAFAATVCDIKTDNLNGTDQMQEEKQKTHISIYAGETK